LSGLLQGVCAHKAVARSRVATEPGRYWQHLIVWGHARSVTFAVASGPQVTEM